MIQEHIEKVTQLLYPRGRAFKMPFGGIRAKIHKGLAISEAQLFNDSKAIFYSILPDNDNFSVVDARQWERRLGLITNEATLLADRKAAISRKMQHPAPIKPRQHWLYIQTQLQAANFNVWVHENLTALNPLEFGAQFVTDGELDEYELDGGELGSGEDYIQSLITFNSELGGFELGGSQFDFFWNNIIANSLEQSEDSFFDEVSHECSFYIGGETAGEFADVDANRELEFRQLILKLKPANMIGFLFVNYI